MDRRVCAVVPVVLLAIVGCEKGAKTSSATPAPAAAPAASTPARLYEGMGPHTRKVTTSSAEAQRYFDQGLNWAYAFNHDEAIRSFRKCAELDPSCAMAYWGIALCNGPHINNPMMDEDHSKAAWSALQDAKARAGNCTPAEKTLIDALASRYADPGKGKIPLMPDERAPLDKGYADAMARVYASFPNDSDVATLYAEALMDLRPWDLYDVKGNPRPETPTVVATLEKAMALAPNNPGANHLYVHAVEASLAPERADAAADRLRTLVPASGHLVHMPGHIDIRRGRWEQASEQNRQAIRIDAAYRRQAPRQGFYNVYMAHNHEFLAFTCMMTGRREEAKKAARAMRAEIPKDWLEANAPGVDGHLALDLEVLMRFGEWDAILAHPQPEAYLPITTAMWRFTRASAYAARGDVSLARGEQEEFRKASKAIPADAMISVNTAHAILDIADHVLEGEIALREKRIDDAVGHLRQAAALEDELRYMEPPEWIQPTRHALGAVLLSAGRAAEAEKVYREDLARWPENGWSLFGLAKSLEAQNSPEAPAVMARFKKAWARADTPIEATCLCVKKAGG